MENFQPAATISGTSVSLGSSISDETLFEEL